MKSLGKSIVLFTSCTVSSVRAFGPVLEPLSKSICHTFQDRRCPSQLQASEHNESLRLIASEFSFVPALFEDLDDFSLLFERDLFWGTFPLLEEQADALAHQVFNENETIEYDTWDSCGDECNDCEIPSDWNVPETIDVMEFLGVTRVKPLC